MAAHPTDDEVRQGFDPRYRYDVTADGRRFLFNVPTDDSTTSAFTVLLDWPALLKR